MSTPSPTSTASSPAREELKLGKLSSAIALATAQVKSKPADISNRQLLCDLLLFAGDLDRADSQLDAIGQLDTKAMLDVAMTRHLVRAEQARRDFYFSGRLPEFLDQPSGELKLRLEASIRIREGKSSEAAEFLKQADEQRPRVSGTADGEAFDDFRDLDDLSASFLEVLTSTGKYYWVPAERIDLIEFHPPERHRDLIWRRAHMIVRDGPDGEVFLPTLYPNTHASSNEHVKLGRETDWIGGDGVSPARGMGLRVFLLGERDCSILELTSVEFNSDSN